MHVKTSRLLCCCRTFCFLTWLPMLATPGLAIAATTAAETPVVPPALVDPAPLDVAEIVKAPIPPSKSELADSAFKKLDITKKGYVTRDEVRELQGFGEVFDAVDQKSTGQLDAEQFKEAWERYTGHDD